MNLNWEVRLRTFPSGRMETNVVSLSVAGDPSFEEEIIARCESVVLANAVVDAIYDQMGQEELW